MDFSPGVIFVSTIFGIVGIYFFRDGKRDGSFSKMLAGVGLMVYSLFVKGIWANLLVGMLLVSLPWLLALVS